MAEISTQLIIDAVTLALRSAFPEAPIITAEDIEQSNEHGAFLVQLLSSSQQQFLGERYKRIPIIDVVYFGETIASCIGVADELSMVLKTITTPMQDVLHGNNIEWRVEGDILHFIVHYRHFIRVDQPKEEMETLTILKGGQ